VLYEMLTGEPPFNGPTPQAIVARVMTEEPRSLTLQRKSIPPHVEAAVNTALEKLPADRFASAREFADALEGKATARTAARATAATRQGHPATHRPVVLAAVAVLLIAVTALVTSFLRGRAPTLPPARFVMTLPGEVPPVAVKLSPDGTTIAYSAAGSGDQLAIFVRRLDELTPRRLEGTEDAAALSFSADGQWIAFITSAGTPKRVSVAGGGVVPIPVRGGGTILQVDFIGNDRYLLTLGDRSLALMGGDGALEVITSPMADRDSLVIEVNQVLPDGWVLGRYWQSPPFGAVIAFEPGSGERIVLVDQLVSWAGAGDGFLAWALPDGTLFTAPFDAKAKRLTGPAVPLGGNVFAVLGFPPPAAAAAHALIYVPSRSRILTRVDRSGASSTLLATERSYHSPRISPDGRAIAMDFTEQQREVWLFDRRDSTLTRFGFDSSAHDPTWLPDGSGLLFAAGRGSEIGIFRRRFDGPPEAEKIFLRGTQTSAHTVTPDGRTAIAVDISRGNFDLFAVPLDGSGKLDTLAGTAFNEGYPAVSPDGRWLAYASDESGRWEVYVRGYPGSGQRVQVSQQGGIEPVWSRSGRELFYRSSSGAGPKLVAATVETGAGFRVAARRELFDVASIEFATPHANYDVFPDGQSFVMVRQGRPGQSAELVYVQNVEALLRGGGAGR
jgi:serine/threonine-protein kinase